jgi:hypothetical protein
MGLSVPSRLPRTPSDIDSWLDQNTVHLQTTLLVHICVSFCCSFKHYEDFEANAMLFSLPAMVPELYDCMCKHRYAQMQDKHVSDILV